MPQATRTQKPKFHDRQQKIFAVLWLYFLTPFGASASQESIVAKPNYSFEKRQRDLEKKRKQEEKRQRKLAEKKDGKADGEPPEEGGTAADTAAE